MDIYHYNFLTHKPKYMYTTDKRRLRKTEPHYSNNKGSNLDKWANDFGFKKSIKAFFGIDDEFPQPDYSTRGPAKDWNDLETSKSRSNLSESYLRRKESLPSLIV